MGKRKFQFKNLSPRHRRILDAVAHGETHRAIAERLGVSESLIGRVVHSDAGRDHLEKLLDQMDERAIRIGAEMSVFRQAGELLAEAQRLQRQQKRVQPFPKPSKAAS